MRLCKSKGQSGRSRGVEYIGCALVVVVISFICDFDNGTHVHLPIISYYMLYSYIVVCIRSDRLDHSLSFKS